MFRQNALVFTKLLQGYKIDYLAFNMNMNRTENEKKNTYEKLYLQILKNCTNGFQFKRETFSTDNFIYGFKRNSTYMYKYVCIRNAFDENIQITDTIQYKLYTQCMHACDAGTVTVAVV